MEKKLIKLEIESRIFTIRGMQVMLDSDIAFILQVDTKRINEQVKRNTSRFPKEFCFQLSNSEWNTLKSQIATSLMKPGGKVKSPWVFTEHGIAMLATRLNSDLASQISVEIINVFVSVKRSSLDFIRINGRELCNIYDIGIFASVFINSYIYFIKNLSYSRYGVLWHCLIHLIGSLGLVCQTKAYHIIVANYKYYDTIAY